jgi:8-oxo-dGTP pyrophosphatase MutT (NUDIX family)
MGRAMTHIDRIAAALARPQAPSSDFDLNPQFRPQGRALRAAAVLLAVVERPAGPAVLLTKRASGLRHHPGQIALPGGRVDDTDASIAAAALREAWEEVALDPGAVRVLGEMPPHETVTGYAMTPVVAHVTADFAPRIQQDEVAEAFFVPFAHVADPGNYRVERRQWLGQWRSYWAVPWGPYYIWGATARVLRALAEGVSR